MTPPLAESTSSTVDSTSDPELAERFQRDAIPLLDALYRRAMHMTRQRADAEDLVQDTMLRAYRSFGTFEEGTNLNAWLHRVLTNTYITNYRKKQRQPMEYQGETLTDHQIAATAEHSSAGLPSAEDEVLAMLPDNQIRAAMQALPDGWRTAVYYADVEGLKYQEIAQIMHTPMGTVMSRIYRGRRQLRNLVTSHAD